MLAVRAFIFQPLSVAGALDPLHSCQNRGPETLRPFIHSLYSSVPVVETGFEPSSWVPSPTRKVCALPRACPQTHPDPLSQSSHWLQSVAFPAGLPGLALEELRPSHAGRLIWSGLLVLVIR